MLHAWESEREGEKHILCKTCPHSSFCENSPSVQRNHIMKLSLQKTQKGVIGRLYFREQTVMSSGSSNLFFFFFKQPPKSKPVQPLSSTSLSLLSAHTAEKTVCFGCFFLLLPPPLPPPLLSSFFPPSLSNICWPILEKPKKRREEEKFTDLSAVLRETDSKDVWIRAAHMPQPFPPGTDRIFWSSNLV